MAADAYARVIGSRGCAVATSGPGASNMITEIAGPGWAIPPHFKTL